MQEQRSAVGSLPETLGFDHGCTSSDAAIDHQQVRWNDIHSSGHDMLPEYIALHGDPPNVPYLNPMSQGGHNLSGWSVGEPSSGGTQAHARHNEWKTEHGVAPMLEERNYEPANTLSLNNVSVNCSSNQLGHAPLFVQSSSNAILQDLNMTAGFVGHRTDDSLIMDQSDGSQNLQNPSATSSSDPFRMLSGSGGFLVEGNDGRPGSSMEGQRASCKRKVFDGSIGQSSRSGSPSYYHQAESSHWQAASGRFNAGSSLSISTPSDNVAGINLRSAERVNSRLGLGVAGAASGNSLAVNVEGNPTPRRNYRARTIPSREQDFLPINVFPGSTNMSSQQSSRVPPASNPLNVTPPPTEGSTTSQRQAVVVRVPSLRRSSHSSRWNNGSSSRPGNSSSSGVRDGVPQEEPNLTNMPRNISEHPMFIPATERRNSGQDTVNWSSTGGNISFAGNVASSSRTGPTPGVHQVSGSNRVIHRHSPQYPRRLSEFVRRSLLSSISSESGGQGPSNPPVGSASGSGSGSSQEVALPLGAANHSRLASHPRSAMLVERQLDGTQGIPFPLRTLAAAGEGRNSRLVSEIRSVLDLMRRGEGLRFEDVMILDQSVLFGMADIHDRHRDMRLDVDNMSYEELLALEERIGNVNTGLTEETISDRLKRRKFFSIALSSNLEVEPCCVCQEEYKDGEDVGTLDCGHEFHTDCIKQWLVQKNICPICKTNALSK